VIGRDRQARERTIPLTFKLSDRRPETAAAVADKISDPPDCLAGGGSLQVSG